MPDGHSLTMSIEAAERSALLLSRAAERARRESGHQRRSPNPGQATVIPVDFVRQARLN
ncbi:hypothetical protein [Novosphingobium flavum]|nr:hypothetical protein [Novosphingobium flavum]